jgi:FLVCR family MFS transporter
MGRFADRFRSYKKMIVSLFSISAVAFLIFSLICVNAFPDYLIAGDKGLALLFVFVALGGLCLNSTIPLFYEATMEATYPMPEGTVVCCVVLIISL